MTSWADANTELIREFFGALSARDRGALESRLADDVVWHTPGRSQLAGKAVGAEGVIGQFARGTELSNGTLIIDVLDVMASERHAAVYFRTTAERNGKSLDLEQLAVVTIEEGQITHIDTAPLDLYAYDAFWS
jgi:ketosteroid isomerase-like protein